MKPVLQRIFQLKRRYERLPFFDFLRDDALTPRQRLAFFPCMAPFILAFGDLNRYVMRDEPSTDAYQQRVNLHTHEDDHHWPWYLEDFTKLGHDAPRAPADVMRFLFSDDTRVNRLLMPRLASLVWAAPPVVRLAIIEAIEETGNVLFALTTQLAREYQAQTGVELRYCGEFHFRLESGHAMNSDHTELAAIELDAGTRAQALEAAEQVFDWFAEWTGELLRFARAERPLAVESA
jgi:hypothetical protein